MRQFINHLHAIYLAYQFTDVFKLIIIHCIAFHQPKKIIVFKLRQQVFAVVFIIVKIMYQRIAGFFIFKNRKRKPD